MAQERSIQQTSGAETQRANDARRDREAIAASGLPDELKSLITDVVKRTRLRRRERLSVAQELIGHFEDATDAGVSPDRAKKSFGDPKLAARLIRRAKLRQRGMLYRVMVVARSLALVLLVIYLIAAIRYFTGKPTIRTDYLALMNQRITATPESERAWPIYRNALLKVTPALRSDTANGSDPANGFILGLDSNLLADLSDGVPASRGQPASPAWPAVRKWVEMNRETINEFAGGASKPGLGFVIGQGGSFDDPEMFGFDPKSPRSKADRPLWEQVLPQLTWLRGIAHVLRADALVALEDGDAARVVVRIEQMVQLARQVREGGFLVNDLVGIGIYSLAIDLVDQSLDPARLKAFSESELARIAHAIAGPQQASDLVNLEGERDLFMDMVQRSFTDDGEGDGRLTPAAWDELSRIRGTMSSAMGESDPWALNVLKRAAGPIAMLASPTRRQVVSFYDRYQQAWKASMMSPLREGAGASLLREFKAERRDPIHSTRYALIYAISPSFGRLQVAPERAIAQRDALHVVIAAELDRRRHGDWPATLEVLVPGLLPRVPVDPWTGGPMAYRVGEAGPVVYSVGPDLDDDQGRRPVNADSTSHLRHEQLVMIDHPQIDPVPTAGAIDASGSTSREPGPKPDADWVLFPAIRHAPELTVREDAYWQRVMRIENRTASTELGPGGVDAE